MCSCVFRRQCYSRAGVEDMGRTRYSYPVSPPHLLSQCAPPPPPPSPHPTPLSPSVGRGSASTCSGPPMFHHSSSSDDCDSTIAEYLVTNEVLKCQVKSCFTFESSVPNTTQSLVGLIFDYSSVLLHV
ncbi:unnamed protein product [Meganyctiphanes norvegica]|uniref:Uncharacterized protein n=1 Tax=Meganyctiphanes norvegica TaxID=48144 RepID=A0AAV2PRF8_MEGNR